MRQWHWIRATVCMGALALVSISSAVARAEDEIAEEIPKDAAKKAVADGDVEMTPTEIGVRFTPAMAQAMSFQFTKQMKQRYDLEEDQGQHIEKIITTELMRLVKENAATGRDMIEMSMETMIANDGNFTKDKAVEFAKLAKPAIPALRDFFTRSAGEIGKRMTIKQRLKFTGDMAGIAAGLVVFENRMKRWSAGDVGQRANPFYDSGDHEEGEDGEKEPEDPNETKEHRQARQNAERTVGWQINKETRWDQYVNNAIVYYDLDETQITSARAVLKDCKDRAEAIRTPAWRKKLVENRIAESLAWRLESHFNQGPWKNQLDQSNEKLMRPLNELGDELRSRIDGIPTSKQKAAAKEAVRKALAEKGMKRLPG